MRERVSTRFTTLKTLIQCLEPTIGGEECVYGANSQTDVVTAGGYWRSPDGGEVSAPAGPGGRPGPGVPAEQHLRFPVVPHRQLRGVVKDDEKRD